MFKKPRRLLRLRSTWERMVWRYLRLSKKQQWVQTRVTKTKMLLFGGCCGSLSTVATSLRRKISHSRVCVTAWLCACVMCVCYACVCVYCVFLDAVFCMCVCINTRTDKENKQTNKQNPPGYYNLLTYIIMSKIFFLRSWRVLLHCHLSHPSGSRGPDHTRGGPVVPTGYCRGYPRERPHLV